MDVEKWLEEHGARGIDRTGEVYAGLMPEPATEPLVEATNSYQTA